MTRGSVAIVLQARMGSARLPGKSLATIGNLTLAGRCLARLCSAGRGRVVLATTTLAEDDALVGEAVRAGVRVYRGSPDDVLDRMAAVARQLSAQYIVRATGDNPAVDPGSVVRTLDAVVKGTADHAVEAGMPVGGTVEAMTAAALLAAAGQATEPGDREHVTPFIRRDGSGFRCLVLPAPLALHRPDLRFTVDTADDLDYMRLVFGAIQGPAFAQPTLKDLIAAADRVGPRSEAA